jgi:hypothetical protein
LLSRPLQEKDHFSAAMIIFSGFSVAAENTAIFSGFFGPPKLKLLSVIFFVGPSKILAQDI